MLQGSQTIGVCFPCSPFMRIWRCSMGSAYPERLSDRRRNARLIQFHKAVHNLSPISVSGLQQPTRCTRSSSSGLTFIPLHARRDALKFSFMHRTLIDWNSLPAPNRSIVPAFPSKIFLNLPYASHQQ